jgi:siroheme synthase
MVENVSLPGSRQLRTTLAELPAVAQQLGSGPAIILLGAAFARADAITLNAYSATPAQAASA